MRIANEIIRLIEAKKAFTDLNIRPGYPMAYRTPMGYASTSEESLTEQDIKDFCELADGQWEKRITAGEGQFDCGLTLKGQARLRCNFYWYGQNNSIGVVVRKLPITPPKIDEIGISFEIKRMIQTQPKGLILVSGPTGSGKSTTLAAIIEYLNETRPFSIVTLEQPIEYEFMQKRSVIVQREIPNNVATFQKGIESAKRQDPDVIMVGEIRDRGTVDAMLSAACSGHLVLATTHARSAQESCESLLTYYADEELRQKRSLLAASLLAVNSQVLLPSVNGDAFVLGYELMINSPQISGLIRDGKTREIGTLMQNQNGGTATVVSLNERLIKMVESNAISKKDALAHAYDKEALERYLS